MADVCQQKRYYDRKIGTVNLKPGDLVLVKANAFKGKRKIKDRLEEETLEVVYQITTDIPSYEVMNPHRRSCILHQNCLLLVASEVGVPLCMGNHHTWDRCTSPTPCKTTSVRGEMKWTCHKRTMVRQSPNDLPVKLPWGGKMGSYDICHGHLPKHPQKMGEALQVTVMQLQTLEGTCMYGGGNDVNAH